MEKLCKPANKFCPELTNLTLPEMTPYFASLMYAIEQVHVVQKEIDFDQCKFVADKGQI